MTSKSLGKAKLKDKGKLKRKEIVKVKVNGTDNIKCQEEVCADLDSLSSVVEAGSSVMKITRDMIFPMSFDHDLVDIITHSEVTRGLSVVKVTREMS